MTDHNHSTHVEGCYHCDLSRDEVAADRPDLDALADRLNGLAVLLYEDRDPVDSNDLRTAARILRAVAAAPGPLREWAYWHRMTQTAMPVQAWMHDLADAVGEP